MLAVGADELGEDIREYTECPNCGELHRVRYGHAVMKDGTMKPSKTLGFVKCDNGSSYLVAIDGKELKFNS